MSQPAQQARGSELHHHGARDTCQTGWLAAIPQQGDGSPIHSRCQLGVGEVPRLSAKLQGTTAHGQSQAVLAGGLAKMDGQPVS